MPGNVCAPLFFKYKLPPIFFKDDFQPSTILLILIYVSTNLYACILYIIISFFSN
jgi:hypothetical protein